MSNEVLTLADFGDNIDGFGVHSQEQLDELNKALGTGTTGDAYGNFADGSALRPESLEGTLKTIIATEKHIKLWKDINKIPAYNTVEEFNMLDSYGGDSSPFFVEGGLPEEEDSNYVRKAALVKFLGTTRVITHPMTLVRSAHGDVVARETRNGTLWLLQQLERALFFADSRMSPIAFDGLMRQISQAPATANNIIDLRGMPLNEDVLEDGGNIVLDNYGFPSKMYLTPKALTDLSKVTYARQRGTFGAKAGTLGQTLKSFESNGGEFPFEPDVFLRPRGVFPTAGRDGAPDTPAWDGGAPLTAAPTTGDFSLPAGTYTYRVTAVNAKGESAASAAETVVVAAGEQVTVAFDRVAAAPLPHCYRIYRDNADGTVLFMTEVPTDGINNITYVDFNQDIPGTSTAFLLDMDGEQSLSYKQLAPLMKLPLARISAAERFMILLYGMPLVYNPKRNVIYKNIGTVSDQVLNDLFPTRAIAGSGWDPSAVGGANIVNPV